MKKRSPAAMMQEVHEEFNVAKFKSHYIVPPLKNLDVSMLIFSYLWTAREAPAMIKQINSKGH